MARTYTVKCIDNRHIEISKPPGDKLSIVLKWKEKTTLCGLWFTPEESKKLKKAINDFVVD